MVDYQKNSSSSSQPAATRNNGAKRNGGSGDRTRMSGTRSDGSRNRQENNKTTKGRNNKRTSAGSSAGAKITKQESDCEVSKVSKNTPKPNMVDGAMQTSTPLRLHLDGMFGAAIAGGYQRPCLRSVESESTEEEDDDVTSEMGGFVTTPLSSRRSSSPRALPNTKDMECSHDHFVKYEWAQGLGKQQYLYSQSEVPRCFEDLENSHEQKLLCITKQLKEMVRTRNDQ
ncbi:uncharacterized protein ZBIST_2394 [Zygosaccharomyces bailii]|uniref:ZYBA0S04-01376g1_1 n=1 Tax=Zygosaccharomyces bailii (strain CLIB 213 / ATCC 58445 / CBS 680 / BCRC 21525 / NBRC 1098 / NCYC 1416 / NRRL Y-2227) TaxID=1333698 RepID=A0A8J2T703_ZYGB2|nr:ZYBA0S04-01376g1_1 [Zygosaccharomyces bailii CLIB 213]CDH08274.1 uncharacterized protein ZBAI_00056 [Zygosaccharomyces bailii ISA1307]SJM85688.1 uncharacterized protein ZBIST_2394 [Zygosaccharomyces bailii]